MADWAVQQNRQLVELWSCWLDGLNIASESVREIEMRKPIAIYLFNVQAVTKGRPRLGRTRVFTPQRTRDFESLIAGMSMSQRQAKEPLTVPIGIVVTFNLVADRGDIDNLQKSLFDGMQGVLYKNDSQIKWVFVLKRKVEDAEATIRVKIYGGESWRYLCPGIFN